MMKPLPKAKNLLKPKLLSSSIQIINTQPIKCQKISRDCPNTNNNLLFSPIQLIKTIPIDIHLNANKKKAKSKDDKILITSTRAPISITTNALRTIENASFIYQDKASLNIDLSQSLIQKKKPEKTPIPLDPLPSVSSNNASAIGNDKVSNYLNYNLGDTKNFTQLDEILLDYNNKSNANAAVRGNNQKERACNDNNTPSTKEMEIELSKASIQFDSMLIGTKLNYQKQANPTKHIFSNNSVYNMDTNEYDEGEKKKSIYILNIQENVNNFKTEYCLTEFSLNNQSKPVYNYPKRNRNVKNNQMKTVDSQNNNRADSKEPQYFKKLHPNSLIKTNRSCFRIPKNKS